MEAPLQRVYNKSYLYFSTDLRGCQEIKVNLRGFFAFFGDLRRKVGGFASRPREFVGVNL